MKKRTPKIYLRDTNETLVKHWKQYFKPFPEVEVSQGDIFDVKATAIVSPANSFGYMTGGIDLLYRDKFGEKVEALVKKNIDMHFYGELPVGSALSVPMRGQNYKHLISAPTMRVPMSVDNTLNPYLSFRAALLVAKDKDFESILCPGMGTGSGTACPEMAARQMFIAYITVVLDITPKFGEHIYKQMGWMLRCSQDAKPIGV